MQTATKRLPKFWEIDSNNSDLYDATIDEKVTYQGKPAILISAVRAVHSNYLHLQQVIDGNSWYGKRVRFSCFVKTEDVDCRAAVSVSVQAPSGNLIVYDSMIDRSLKGKNDWTKLEVVIDIPADGRWITYGPRLWGKGKMWIAQFEIEQVSNETERTDNHGACFLLQGHPANIDFANASDLKSPQGEPALLAGWSRPHENRDFKFSVLKNEFDGANVTVIESSKAPDPAVPFVHNKNNIGYICQTFAAKPFRGARIKFSSFIKTENIHGEAVIVLMINGVNYSRLALSRLDPLEGDNDWAEYSCILDVSNFAYSISIWLQMSGYGKVSFAKVAVQSVTDDVPTTDGNHHPKNLDFSQ